ncbi:hypothetical protein SAMN05877753_103312 [Bacillus oleivorans]|uniref:Uncharacterized protein n=1 Tax=Bacillus oleivorans TaxID=1448271 RepID=A0A285CQS6_9BACI|nr:hypothetical protein [Bacillus oleivorans]SNX69930.1 hypothetical protein SAMN05877753_103312 [Bacillus oleivorans]
MTRHQCKWILIGLLIAFFDFRFENVNLVPDIAGWGIIIYQLSEARNHYKTYSTARILAILLFGLSIPDLFTVQWDYSLEHSNFLLGLISSVSYLAFILKLLEGMALQLEKQSWLEKSKSMWKFRKVYGMFALIPMGFICLAAIIPGAWGLYMSFLPLIAIGIIVVQIFLFVRLYDTRTIIEEYGPTTS